MPSRGQSFASVLMKLFQIPKSVMWGKKKTRSLNLAQNVCLDDSRSSSKLEHLGSKTRSPGQISVKSFYHSSSHIFQAIIMNLAQNVRLDEF